MGLLKNEIKELFSFQLLTEAKKAVIIRSSRYGGVPEWLKGADCKSVGLRLRWFESIPLHQRNFRKANFSNAARKDTRSRWSNSSCDSLHPLHEACPCGSVVEHSLGKGEVMRSIRIMGTRIPFYVQSDPTYPKADLCSFRSRQWPRKNLSARSRM